MSHRWWSQPFAPEGSAAAEGIAKQLGRPALDPLTVLVRESAQNSWDARRRDVELSFHVSVRHLGTDAQGWREVLMPAPPPNAEVDLDVALAADSPMILISDRGTVGLGGPLRAGQRAAAEERPDFVQFLRNVGEPSDHALGGGTYGFGKGILYRLSAASTILVDTFTVDGQGPRRRLMAATLGHSWYLGDQRYTGRHWWGVVGEDGVPDPVLDDEAAELARQLGLPGFDDGRTGTDIAILGADLGLTGEESELRPRTRQEAATFIASSILWHLWPKAVPRGDDVNIDFSVDVDGNRLEMPMPSQVADLRPFVDALDLIRRGEGRPLTRREHPRTVGAFALALAGAAAGSRLERQLVTLARPFDGPAHHVVRMRDAELVVDYLEASPHPDSLLCYGAVFKASTDADVHFAAAEPPTHDDWIDKGLSGTSRGVVQGAKRFVHKEVDARLGGGAAVGPGTGGLGGLAVRLSSLLPLPNPARRPDGDSPTLHRPDASGKELLAGGSATSIGDRDGNTPTGRAPAPRTLRLVDPPRLYMDGADPFLAARLAIPASAFSRTIFVEVQVITQSGGVEGEPPVGGAVRSVDQWEPVEGGTRHHGATLLLPPGEASEWWVMAQHVPDAVIRFRPRQVEHREN